MIAYDRISYTDLKSVCKSANLSGLLPENIRHVAVKGVQMYDNFISAIEKLPNEVKIELPEDVIDFFNYAISDPDAEQEQEELDFDPKEVREEPEPEFEPEFEPETTPTPVRKAKKKAAEEPTEAVKVEPAKEPTKKVARLSTTPMTPKIEDSKLTIVFKELNAKKTIVLPTIDDKEKLKAVRKKAMEFAVENGATKGQLCNISKILNMAGYYMR